MKILTFRASSIGDALMAKYFLECAREAHPDGRFGIVVGSRGGMIRDLFAAYPWLEVIEANRRKPRLLFSLWREWHGCDVVLTQYAGKEGGSFSAPSKLFARVIAKRKGLIGFEDASPKLNSALYDILLPLPKDKAPLALERDALKVIGRVPVSLQPSLRHVDKGTLLKRLNLIPNEYLVLHLFSGADARGLSPERRRKVAAEVVKALPGVPIVITGSRAEQHSLGVISDGRVQRPQTTLQEVIELVAHARGVLSLDTGVAHIAAHLQKPLALMVSCVGMSWWSEGMYGPEIPRILLAHHEKCSNGHDFSSFAPCLQAIELPEIVAASKKLFT